MAETTDFDKSLFKALEDRVAWFDTHILPPMLDEYRILHSCTNNLINVLIQKGIIAADPYKLEKKISDIEVPAESDFIETDKYMAIGIRLSDYESSIDFLCNYFKFSVITLTVERIKKLVALNNYFQWNAMAPSNPQPNTKGLAEIINQIRQGTDTLAISVVNNCVTTAAKVISKVSAILKETTELQKELYKAEVRKTVFSHPSYSAEKAAESNQSALTQIKKLYPAVMGKRPFYPELIDEIIAEDNGAQRDAKRKALLDKLKVNEQTPEKKAIQVNTKEMLMEAVRTLSAMAPLLTVLLEKINENSDILQGEHQSVWEKFKKVCRKAFNIQEKPIEYVITLTDSVTQTTRKERVNFQKFTGDISKRINFYASLASHRTPGYQKTESEPEPEILNFLTAQLSECQQLLSVLYAFDNFFKTAPQEINKPRIKGLKMELTAIKNTMVKTNQRRAEYSAFVEEQQQMRKLGIKDVY
ncbi:hypothetical protein [Treponema brennaborense]|uniref:Uncharacterized protein n=1 Tax=Treponema brennaborense (strain DSM 12168 / CIP 105900 / DD5/3) TaxID=906968 RepID=F4LJB6_TREBD|nr:hypothetical protein [Treponema brennaborense]AEE17361.1 hypothetical protein Trebr_1943 [Treponema brennaborense DSM 12168]